MKENTRHGKQVVKKYLPTPTCPWSSKAVMKETTREKMWKESIRKSKADRREKMLEGGKC